MSAGRVTKRMPDTARMALLSNLAFRRDKAPKLVDFGPQKGAPRKCKARKGKSQ